MPNIGGIPSSTKRYSLVIVSWYKNRILTNGSKRLTIFYTYNTITHNYTLQSLSWLTYVSFLPSKALTFSTLSTRRMLTLVWLMLCSIIPIFCFSPDSTTNENTYSIFNLKWFYRMKPYPYTHSHYRPAHIHDVGEV